MAIPFNLRTSRGTANLILLASLVLLIGSALFRDGRIGRWIFLAVEAVFVASFADWFAVSALFGKPLGIGWHTDIIRKQHDAIGTGLSSFIETRLAPQASIIRMIENVSPSALLLTYLETTPESELATRLVDALAGPLRNPDKETVETLHTFLAKIVSNIRFGPLLADQLEAALGNGRGSDALRFVAVWIGKEAGSPEARRFLKREMEAGFAGMSLMERAKLNVFADRDDLIRAAQDALEHLGMELQTGTGVARELEGILKKAVLQLRTPSSVLAKEVEALKEAILADADLHDEIRLALHAGSEPERLEALRRIVANALRAGAARLGEGESSAAVDRKLRSLLIANLPSMYVILKKLLVHVFEERLTRDELVAYIDRTIGDPLHGIRVTGAIVGLVVGLGLGAVRMAFGH